MNKTPLDTISFVEDVLGVKAECQGIANKVGNLLGIKPDETEVLSRCRMVFEYILHEAMKHSKEEDWDIELEIQSEK